LSFAGLTGQLLMGFNDLADARCPNWMTIAN
jgi:hypothetical protein